MKPVIVAFSLFLASCTQVHVASHIFKKVDPGAGPACAMSQNGHLKVGKPYKSHGIWYHPKKSSHGYQNSGIASWYGADFHGRTTANGECYDMYAMTAAHPTLPLPTIVRVTNPENRRSVVLRVNDRGPYAKGRIIDLSYAAARQLGLAKQGVGPVKVEAIGGPHHHPSGYQGSTKGVKTVNDAPRVPRRVLRKSETETVRATTGNENLNLGSKYQPKTAPKPTPSGSFTQRASQSKPAPKPVQQQAYVPRAMQHQKLDPAPPPPAPETVPTTSAEPLKTKLYVQVGAFGNKTNAERLEKKVAAQGMQTRLQPFNRGDKTLHRVQAGPFNSVAQADIALADLLKAGFNTAVIALEN